MKQTLDKKPKRYYTRVIKSGNYYEHKEYQLPVFYDFSAKDRVTGVRKPTKRRLDNVQRSKNGLIRKVLSNCESTKPLFLTLTYASNMEDRAQAVEDFKRYVRFLRSVYGKVDYVYVLETQERGAWHIHVLIFNRAFIPIRMLRAVWRYVIEEKTARVQIEQTEDDLHSARYIAKYLGKEEVTPGNRLYSASIGLAKPITLRHDTKWANFSVPEFGSCEYSISYFDVDKQLINLDIYYDKAGSASSRLFEQGRS